MLSLLALRPTAVVAVAAAFARLPVLTLVRPALRPLPPPDPRQLCLVLASPRGDDGVVDDLRPAVLERAPVLAALPIVEAALGVLVLALRAQHPSLHRTRPDRCDSQLRRAHSLVALADVLRSLAAASPRGHHLARRDHFPY